MSFSMLNAIKFQSSITQISNYESLPESLNDIGTGREEVLECLDLFSQNLVY